MAIPLKNTICKKARFISFIRCGRTWFLFMLQSISRQLGHGKKIHFVQHLHDRSSVVPIPRPGKKYLRKKGQYSGLDIVFLIRDPRDVIVSVWHLMYYRYGPMGVRDPAKINKLKLPEFLRHGFGLDHYLNFLNDWAKAFKQGVPRRYMVVRYEDIVLNQEAELRRVLRFLNIKGVTSEMTRKACEETTFENVRKIHKWGNAGAGEDRRKWFARRGQAGAYVDYFTADDIDWMNSRIDEVLDKEYYPFYLTEAK